MITYSCKILSNIIKDILFSSKLDSGNLSLDKVRFSMKKAVEQVVLISSVTALKRGIDVALLIDVSKQAIKLPNIMYGDVSKFQQILTNLMGNAIKFTERGSVTVRVSVKERIGNQVRVAVAIKDTGIGISKAKVPQLFKMFSRVHEDRKFEGTGLGLAICKNLVSLMSGEIGVKSRVNEGSEFWFSVLFQTSQEKLKFPVGASNILKRRGTTETTDSDGERRASLLEDNKSNTSGDDSDQEGINNNNEDDDESEKNKLQYSDIHDYVNKHMKGTVMLIIYNSEIVRDITRRYMISFGVECCFVKNSEGIMKDAESLRSGLYETLYGGSKKSTISSKRSKWLVQKPISTVLIDDNVFWNHNHAFQNQQLNLFDSNSSGANNASNGASSNGSNSNHDRDVDPNNLFNSHSVDPKQSASQLVRRSSHTFMFERVGKLMNKLKVLIYNHNLKCDGQLQEHIQYVCAYHQFDIHKFHQQQQFETFNASFRKPLLLSTVEKMFRDMAASVKKRDTQSMQDKQFMTGDQLVSGSGPSFLTIPAQRYALSRKRMSLQPRDEAILPPLYPRNQQLLTGDLDEDVDEMSDVAIVQNEEMFSNYKFPLRRESNDMNVTFGAMPATSLTDQQNMYKKQLAVDLSGYRKSSSPAIFHIDPRRNQQQLKAISPPMLSFQNNAQSRSSNDLTRMMNAPLPLPAQRTPPPPNTYPSTSTQEMDMQQGIATASSSSSSSTSEVVSSSSAAAAAAATSSDVLELNVIVADDNLLNRKIIMGIVQRCNIVDSGNNVKHGLLEVIRKHKIKSLKVTPTPAEHGQKVLNIINENQSSKFDLIFMDVHMDVMDGIESTKKIRCGEVGKDDHVMIVGVTGADNAEEECIQAGMDDVLPKPTPIPRLHETIAKVIAKRMESKN
ncbi:hypothetical protein AKO1_013348 [Acrasis kona]|uniref:Uncharacterized protein n=1 Tax=Acrasis kona TaxID=1008807 RepID=A0AAW2YY88_9EUKA